MKLRILTLIIFQLLFCNFLALSQEHNTDKKPIITNSICLKLWYGCQRYDMAKALFYHTMGAQGIIENDRLMERMKNGDTEVGEKYIHVIQKLYGRQDAWANFKIFGFNQDELEITDNLYTYFENQEKIVERQKQEEQFKEWTVSGVPSNIKPSDKAELYCLDADAVIQYLNANPGLIEGRSYEFNVFVGADKSIRLIDANKPDVVDIFKNLHLAVREPAFYVFDEIDEELPMGSVVEISLEFNLRNISSRYRSEFEASTKYDKKNDIWNIKITKDDIDRFNADTRGNQDIYIKAIETALRCSDEKPKKYITFELYNVNLWFTYEGDEYYGTTNHSLISQEQLNPIAIITGSQSAFSRFQNR